MSIYDCNLWIEDIDRVLQVIPELEKIENHSILVTGATGMICSALTDILIRYNETHIKNIQIYVAGRNENDMKERFGEFYNREYFHFVQYDSSKSDNIFRFNVDYIIHGAANSSPKKIIDEPVETMLGNFIGIKDLLDFAKKSKSQRVLYISSSEVYGKKELNGAFKEEDYGFVDILNIRNSYSVGKQAAETLCISYSDEYGVNSVIVRPGHIYGPTAKKTDDHVASAWAYDVALGNDIVMKSNGMQIRSYVYCLDCASAILKVLMCGERGKAYNISNADSTISIKEMALILSKVGNVELRMESANFEEAKGFNLMSNSSLDSTKLLNIGWKSCFDAETGFNHTVRILKESGKC